MPDPESSPRGPVVTAIEKLSGAAGHLAAWLALGMVALTVVIVVLRYALDLGFIWLQELLTWLHAAVFMLGAAYALSLDEHVRVDVFYRSMTARKRAWVNLIGTLVFILPVCGFLLLTSYDYVHAAWSIGEVSRDSGGLPYPAIPLLKSLLLVMPLALALQGLALALRALRTIRSS